MGQRKSSSIFNTTSEAVGSWFGETWSRLVTVGSSSIAMLQRRLTSSFALLCYAGPDRVPPRQPAFCLYVDVALYYYDHRPSCRCNVAFQLDWTTVTLAVQCDNVGTLSCLGGYNLRLRYVLADVWRSQFDMTDFQCCSLAAVLITVSLLIGVWYCSVC